MRGHSLSQRKVPVGILLTSHSNTRIEAFTERGAIEAHPLLKGDAGLIHDGDVTTTQGRAAFGKFHQDLAAWQVASAKLGFPVERPLPRPGLPGIAGQWRGPSQFFNGKIAPVVPYAIRGSIWCQGTSNSGDGRIYAARMEALVNGWRDAWGMPEMPFYFTQMQGYGAANSEDGGFADIRQAQHLFFINHRSHVGMVVQTDLNPANPGGIHYQNKLHPGMRLARWALAHDYGREIAYQFAKALGRPGIPQGFVTMSSGQGGRAAQMASPLAWTSCAGIKDTDHPALRARMDALLLQDPASEVSRKAAAGYVEEVKACVARIIEMADQGADLALAPLQFPAYPEPGRDGGVKPDTVPTLAYNWCVSPLTPMAVAGVVWVPGEFNIGYTPADYAAELEIYARSLPATYGQDRVPFLYAQPAGSLVEGIATPSIPGAKCLPCAQWPKSLKEIAAELGKMAGS